MKEYDGEFTQAREEEKRHEGKEEFAAKLLEEDFPARHVEVVVQRPPPLRDIVATIPNSTRTVRSINQGLPDVG